MSDLKSRLFFERERLLPSHIPRRIIHRRHELSRLMDLLEPMTEGGADNQVVISGGHGAGKTLVANRIEAYLRASAEERDVELTSLHINCRTEKTPGNIVRNIVSRVAPHLSLRGYSLEEMLQGAIKYAEGMRTRILLVLDDSDLIFKIHPETIYLFSRLHEAMPERKIVSFLLIIESMDTLRRSDPRITSTLRRNLVPFEDYDRYELRDMLEERVEAAFLQGAVPVETIEACVDISSTPRCDVGYALAVLRRGGEIAEAQGSLLVSPEHLRVAVGDVPPSPLFDELDDLSTHEKFILFSLYSLVKSRGLNLVAMGILEDRYREVCGEYGVKPVGHTWLWRKVGILSQLGFISSRVSGKGRRGKTTLISPALSPLESVYERLSSSLRRERFLVGEEG